MKITESADLAFLGIPSMSSQRILRIPCRYTMLHAHPQNQPWPKPEKKGHDLKTKLWHHRFKFLCKKTSWRKTTKQFLNGYFPNSPHICPKWLWKLDGSQKGPNPVTVANSSFWDSSLCLAKWCWICSTFTGGAHESNLVTFPALSIWNDRMSSTSNHKIDETLFFLNILKKKKTGEYSVVSLQNRCLNDSKSRDQHLSPPSTKHDSEFDFHATWHQWLQKWSNS